MDFSRERVAAHNGWPKSGQFQAEIAFETRLKQMKGVAPFETLQLRALKNVDFQRCVGHLIDGLDALPYRPDYFFDHCFKVIDYSGSLGPEVGKGIKGITNNLGTKLLNHDQAQWETVTDVLCKEMPIGLYELLARRLLQAELAVVGDKTLGGLKARAETCMGPSRYAALMAKYALDSSGNVLPDAVKLNSKKLAGFLKLYLSGKTSTSGKPASHPSLDMNKQANVPSYPARIRIILSLLLFTVRNERFHGNTMSPFRTSKGKIDRYQRYYFMMLLAYAFALGVMSLRWACVNPGSILACCSQNVAIQKTFF